MSTFFRNKIYINAFLVIAIFIISILVRLDNLTAPIGRHHEFITGHVMTTVSIFETNGLAKHYFSPVCTFSNEGDLALNRTGILGDKIKDKNGYNYYTSYPPFCFLFPYFIFKAVGTECSIIAIRVLGLINNFVCGLLIFLIINRVFDKSCKKEVYFPAYIAYFVYIFSAGNLWFHANVWFADILVHLFILSSLYLFTFIIGAPSSNMKRKAFLLFIFTFFGVYTEYLALFLAGFMGLFFLIKSFSNKKFTIYFVSIGLASVMSIGLTVYQYTRISGFDELKRVSNDKYELRSGRSHDFQMAGEATLYSSWALKKFWNNYTVNYGLTMLFFFAGLVTILVMLLINTEIKRITIKLSQFLIPIFLFLSILAHHYLFFNFSATHDFSTFKTSMVASICIGIAIALLYNFININKVKNWAIGVICLFSILFFSFSLDNYYNVNCNNKESLMQKAVGDAVLKYANDDQVVFTDQYQTPVIDWYAKRNVVGIGNKNLNFVSSYVTQCKKKEGLFVRGNYRNNKIILTVSKIVNCKDSVFVGTEEVNL
jgi:hypothetical protein